MKSGNFGSSFLILIVALSATLALAQNLHHTRIDDLIAAESLDYKTSLRPTTHKKRSISSIVKLLLGGNVPPNHPLVKESQPKSWNLANNILSSFGGGSSGGHSHGWRPTAAEQLAQIFATKAKILPYTGQVASGLTGIAAVKGDVLKQIHALSTAVIAQAAAEAAARAVQGASLAQAVSSQVAHAAPQAIDNFGSILQATTAAKAGLLKTTANLAKANAQASFYAHGGTGYGNSGNNGGRYNNEGWGSNQQNAYALPQQTKLPIEQAGPPYPSNSDFFQAHQTQSYQHSYPSQQQQQQQQQQQADYGKISQYQTAPSAVNQQYATPTHQNTQTGYSDIYNQYVNSDNRQNIDYSTLGQRSRAQGYNPLLSSPLLTNALATNNMTMLIMALTNSSFVDPQLMQNLSLNLNFLSAASANEFGRNAEEPPSILSSLATLIAASTSAYNSLSNIATGAAPPAASADGHVAAESEPVPSVAIPPTTNRHSAVSADSRSFDGQHQSGARSLGGDQQQLSLQQSSQQTFPSFIHSSSNPLRSQHVSNNAYTNSRQTFRNSPSTGVYDASFSRGQGIGAGASRRRYSTDFPSHNSNARSGGPGTFTFGRFGSQPSPFQAAHQREGGFRGYTDTTPGNFNSPPRGFQKTTHSSPQQFGGQAQKLFSSNNLQHQQFSNTSIPTSSTNRGHSNSAGGLGSPYINYQTLASASELSPKYELPPQSIHSQHNNKGQQQRSHQRNKDGATFPLDTEQVTFTLTIPNQGPATVMKQRARKPVQHQFQARISQPLSMNSQEEEMTQTDHTSPGHTQQPTTNSKEDQTNPSYTLPYHREEEAHKSTPHFPNTSSENIQSTQQNQKNLSSEDQVQDLYNKNLSKSQEEDQVQDLYNQSTEEVASAIEEKESQIQSRSLQQKEEEQKRANSLSEMIHTLLSIQGR